MKHTPIKAVKGFNDCLPGTAAHWRATESALIDVLSSYSYQEVRLPIVERAALFSRAIGDVTDIVEKEMYSFNDRSDPPELLTLRPEGTAGMVRALNEHNLARGNAPRVWYMGPMFRYERPQKGRYRQFHQLGVEVFGLSGPDIDVELILITRAFWKRLGLGGLTLEINTLGESAERAAFKAALKVYLEARKDQLDEDSQRRLSSNPLRILDSKSAQTQQLLKSAPKLMDFLGEQSLKDFTELKVLLDSLGVSYVINPHLVRGLDYYNKFVFEWTTDQLGAQATVCAGGRYDTLVDQLASAQIKSVPTTPAVGFAMGLERLMLLLEQAGEAETLDNPHFYLVAAEEHYAAGVLLAEKLREKHPEWRLRMGSAASVKSQMKKADQCGARYALILGESEVLEQNVTLKNLSTAEQTTITQDALMNEFSLLS